MTIEIKNASNLQSPWTAWFVYGATGGGKTVAASTMPWPIFIVPRNEQSIMTLRGSDIPYIETDTPDDMNQALSYLEQSYAQSQKCLLAGDNQGAWDAFPYQTVVVEAISHYTDLIIEALSGGKMSNGFSVGKMDQQKWGQLGSHLRNIHVRLRSLPVHIVYVALDSVKENDAGVVAGGPLMSGAMAYKLPSACDAIIYMEQIPGQLARRAHFQKRGHFPARIRVPQGTDVPPFIDGFSWDKVKHLFGH